MRACIYLLLTIRKVRAFPWAGVHGGHHLVPVWLTLLNGFALYFVETLLIVEFRIALALFLLDLTEVQLFRHFN
jgi:hypothetical protein